MNTLRNIVLIEAVIAVIILVAINTLLCLDQYGEIIEAFLRDQFYDWQR